MLKTGFLSVSLLATLGALATPAHADDCQPSRLMVMLDKSSSMLDSIGDQTKWDIAKGALGELTQAYQSDLEIGLSVFPAEGQCSPGNVVVEPMMNSTDSILAALQAPPPEGGSWTPMAETMTAAAQFGSLNNPDVPSYVVLVTDGWQYCLPYEDASRGAPIDAVQQLSAQGITTYVVGFGDGVDTATLNQVAVAAGTARPGCDATGEDPNGDNNCYYQANDPNELLEALMDVAKDIPNQELCDGVDNDCDGNVDEAVTQACALDCGQGSSVCSNGSWSTCEIEGVTDENGECPAGDPAGCGCQSSGTKGTLGGLLPLALGFFFLRRRRSRK